MDLVDITRLRFYTFFTEDGLTLHEAGVSALRRFLNARLNLYANVYFHRTTRALDLHLQEIFYDTMKHILPSNPLHSLDEYHLCDDWSLYHIVSSWMSDKHLQKRRLGKEWQKLYSRSVKWKMSFSTELSVNQLQRGIHFSYAEDYEKRIRTFLPKKVKKSAFRVDLATQDPRPVNPMVETEKRINIYNAATGHTSPEPLHEIYRFIPARVVHFRVFSLHHDHDREISKAADKALETLEGSPTTNI